MPLSALPRRRPGRPRSAAADAAILDAARDVLAEDGWAGLTVERVAARAGVAKTTVYRRWSSRTDLAVGAVSVLLTAARTEPGASTYEDVANATRAVVALLRAPAARAAYLSVIAETARDAALRARVQEEMVAPTRQLVVDGLARAAGRGEVPADVDPDLVYDLVAGAIVYRVLVRDAPADEAFVATLAEMACRAAGAPGPPGAGGAAPAAGAAGRAPAAEAAEALRPR